MAGLYVDTSSLGRVLLHEPDADEIREVMAQYTSLWSSRLLEVEFLRLGRRLGFEREAGQLLALVELTPLGHTNLTGAARIEPVEIRALDAIDLEAVVRLYGSATVAAVLTHDKQLRAGCESHGIPLAL